VQGGIIAGVRCALRGSGALGVAIFALGLSAEGACAQSDTPHTEMFTGIETSDNYTSGYVGEGYAFGKDLYAPGLRLRAVGAYGRYDYDGALFEAATMWRRTSTARTVSGPGLCGQSWQTLETKKRSPTRNGLGSVGLSRRVSPLPQWWKTACCHGSLPQWLPPRSPHVCGS